MHGHYRPRAPAGLDACRVEVHRLRVDVDEHGPQTGERDDVRRRRERVRGHEHVVAGSDSEREHGEMQRGGARGHRDRVLDYARARELGLELCDLRPHRQHPAVEYLGDLGQLLGPDVGPR